MCMTTTAAHPWKTRSRILSEPAWCATPVPFPPRSTASLHFRGSALAATSPQSDWCSCPCCAFMLNHPALHWLQVHYRFLSTPLGSPHQVAVYDDCIKQHRDEHGWLGMYSWPRLLL
jgi:hypothetical protein